MSRRRKDEPTYFIIPSIDTMDDELFLKHYNARHRRTDTPGFVIDIPYSVGASYGYFRAFHERRHNEEGSDYDHEHEEL